jgi:hypothetical protein
VLYYSKVQSDARYLRTAGIVTVSSGTASVGAGSYTSATANCPAGFTAIAGGTDTSSGQNVVVAADAPIVEGTQTFGLSAGNHAPPTGWSGYVRNNGVVSQSFTVVAICAPPS